MKPIILKKMMPFAVVVLGTLGAFATTSMQSASKSEAAPIYGYVAIPGNPCGLEVQCSDTGNQVCHLNDDSAQPQAFAKDSQTTCAQEVYRPD
ncbi:DUF6520 family protein [Flavobacterium sp. LHD-80]|uniref:DUF6520 family protein n=1 Tax=Flavobacterium sp. LHD-80 TaxID=3071411 RepID=UPI0027E0C173|nr:DUF6520 family protein [Flavobacterium sp. LHD-80]MDQ6472748.1 DUF6520 family protein [Flavobacterium sp. LHD-80]